MHVLAHGGAGGEPDEPDERSRDLEAAVDAGVEEDTPTAAVVETVTKLESADGFNAGVGSAVQSDGRIRTDAGLMTSEGSCGAACAMTGVERAVAVARAVATETPHVLLAGERAVAFAQSRDIDTVTTLWTERNRSRWEAADPPAADSPGAHLDWVREHYGGTDTVGAVATDGETVATATSTGGRWFALAGRVGDVPQIGAGFYAGDGAAASATGHGEAIARFGLARRVVSAVEAGESPQHAADRLIREFEHRTEATAGVIVLDVIGDSSRAHNAAAMQTASRSADDRGNE